MEVIKRTSGHTAYFGTDMVQRNAGPCVRVMNSTFYTSNLGFDSQRRLLISNMNNNY